MRTSLQLKPYVFRGESDTIPSDWPVHSAKPTEHDNSKRGGIYAGHKGFDGQYYLQLAEFKA